MEPAQHIEKARRLLAQACLPANHAAQACILSQTGERPRTHKGGRSEFGRLARTDARINPAQFSFLGFAYDLTELADYDETMPVSLDKADRALRDATKMADDIAALLTV